jgi:uncharacterized protein (TIGR02646 family)
MIYVNREGDREPDFFIRYRERTLPEVKMMIDAGDQTLYRVPRSEDRFARMVKDVRNVLVEVFYSKCAYCESLLGISEAGVIDHFRPRGGVASEDGGFLPLYYWAQAYDWRNLYLACGICSRSKRNSFPVSGQRGAPDASYAQLRSEERLLIDPCADEPGEDLLFSENGEVIGVSLKGRTTIELLNLNRRPLLWARNKEAARFLRASDAEREELLQIDQPYLGLKRQLLAVAQGASPRANIEQARIEQARLDLERENVSTDKGSGLKNFSARGRYVETVSLDNIGPFPTLELDLTVATTKMGPCFALLGNNGVGKSTVLRAIAIALGGRAYARRLKVRSNDVLRAGYDSGQIRVRVSGYSSDIVVDARRDKPLRFYSSDAKTYLLAFGSSRLMATSRHKAREGMLHATIDNLFDPFSPIHNAQDWLSRDGYNRDEIQATLQSLISDGQGAKVIKAIDRNGFSFDFGDGHACPVEKLSDGYKSLLGMVVEIMQVMTNAGFVSMESAQGVVIIDELGNHFHPAWKMRIVDSLRKAFPYLQFIFSTHEPLCLRGLKDGEVAVFQRDIDGDAYALVNLPSNGSLYVDQLLTSEHFGLESTLDPQRESEVKHYESLVTKQNRTDVDDAKLAELEASLTDAGHLGKTHRERIMLRTIDALLRAAKPSRSSGTIDVNRLDSETIETLKSIFSQLE